LSNEFGGGFPNQPGQGGPPPWGWTPPSQPVRPSRWWRQRRVRALGVLGVLAAVLAGLAASPLAPWRDEPQQQRAPFYLAVADLATMPMVHYTGPAPSAGTSWDLEVTREGERLGTFTASGQKIDVMTAAGRT
jgi:hypothetical protein